MTTPVADGMKWTVRPNSGFKVRLGVILALIVLLLPASVVAAARPATHPGLAPVVLFPGYSFSRLRVVVRNQTVAPGCPRSGTFEEWYLNPHPSTTFSQVCRDKLLTLRFDTGGHEAWSQRFSNQPGVSTSVADYGETESTPFYEPMYKALEAAGYVRDRNIFVAGYDYRLTPDLGKFVLQTKSLIEYAYRVNGNRPVHFVGHSNGPRMPSIF
jgi:lecithin-cholesterol acyltransferase